MGSLLILLTTVYLIPAAYFRWIDFRVEVGPESLHHVLSWSGTLFITFFTPAYYLLKRRYPARMRSLLGVHVIGNLVSFMFVSVHYSHHLGRPAQFFPKLGTGVTLLATLLLLISTGFIQRFGLWRSQAKHLRFIHVSATLSFYIVILVHVLHGLGII